MIGPARRLGAFIFSSVACCLATAGFAVSTPVAYDINVRIDPAARELSGAATIVVQPGKSVELVLAQRFEVECLTVDGETAAAPRVASGLSTWRLVAADTPRRIEMRWHGRLDALDATLDHRQTLDASKPVTGEEGTFLPAASAWYPRVRGRMPGYRVSIDLPHGQRGIVPGRLVEETETGGRYRARFEFPHPAEGIDLMAGPYRVEIRAIKTVHGKTVLLRTYFHPQIAELSAGYLDAVKSYIDLYDNWIGEYPYTEFSIVSSPTPTGFGMPTLTYLGIDVLRLPFIRATSLGHEILHNWWGNGVYPDYARGNWSEGLTTFMADYAYKESENDEAARGMRLEWLRDFAAVPAGQDRPLVEFTSRTHGTSQIVGYGKAAMTFLMLRDLIGRDAFDAGIRRFWRDYRFKTAAWSVLEKSFATASKRDLSAFFAQWLTRQGAPALRMAAAESAGGDAGSRVSVSLAQDKPVYRLHVPLALRSERGNDVRYADLDKGSATFTFKVDARPVELALDPDFRLFRRLGPEEAPPILRQVMIDPSTVTVLAGAPAQALESARLLATNLQDEPPRFRSEDDQFGSVPLLVIGIGDEVDRWLRSRGLPARPDALTKGSAVAWTASLSRGLSMAVVSARDAESLSALVRPLPHYGRKSYVVFDGAKAIESGVWPARPQVRKLAGDK
jgi:aminopeptidase N